MGTHHTSGWKGIVAAALGTLIAGCQVGEIGPSGDELGGERELLQSFNNLSSLAVTVSAFMNPPSISAAASQPLRTATYDAAAGHPHLRYVLRDPLGRDFMKYFAWCALRASDPPVQYLVGTTWYTFYGNIGLAPEAAIGAMSTRGRQDVSACMLAHINPQGLEVLIPLAGEDQNNSGRLDRFNYVPTSTRSSSGATIASYLSCNFLQWNASGESRDCGWTPAHAGTCDPGATVTVGINHPAVCPAAPVSATDFDPMPRIGEGLRGVNYAQRLTDTCTNSVRVARFTCPASGRFNVSRSLFRNSAIVPAGTTYAINVASAKLYQYPGKEMAIFKWPELAFAGDLFEPTGLKYIHTTCDSEGGCITRKAESGVILCSDPAGGALVRATCPLSGVVQQNLRTFTSYLWTEPEAYQRERGCGGPLDKLCPGNYCGEADKQCLYDDYTGDGDYGKCSYGAQAWEHPITTYLFDPCSIIGAARAESPGAAPVTDSGLSAATRTGAAQRTGRPSPPEPRVSLTALTACLPGPRRAGIEVDEELFVPGLQIGRYVIHSAGPEGGYASIYRATDAQTGRQVALKVLHRHLAGQTRILKRFRQEASALNRLHHPHIVDIFASGVLADGRPFIAMEWLAGHNLDEELRLRGPLAPAEALAVLEQIGAGLTAAHSVGIVHRDVKPQNIMVEPRGDWFDVKLVDFGIAKLLDRFNQGGEHSITSRTLLGTPTSMAPEQIRGDAVDVRTDIYALGILLFRLLTGRMPFRAPDPIELEDMHLRAPVPRASESAPVAGALDDIILRAMQKQPERRYPDVESLLADLRAAAVPAPARAPAAGLAGAAVALHIEARIDRADRLDDDALDAAADDIEVALAQARAACAEVGLGAALVTSNSLLASAPLTGSDADRQRARLRVLAAAVELAERLAARPGRRAEVRFALTVHAGDDVSSCGAWTAGHPGSGLAATPQALAGFGGMSRLAPVPGAALFVFRDLR